jgi:hypothetical protein
MFRSSRRGRHRARITPAAHSPTADEADDSSGGPILWGEKVVEASGQRSRIAQAPAVPGYEDASTNNAESIKGSGDYSAEGLAKLTRDTEQVWKRSLNVGDEATGAETLPTVELREMSRLERVLDARANIPTCKQLPIPRSVEYIPLSSQKTIIPPTTNGHREEVVDVALENQKNEVEEELGSDGSVGSAWEMEQLKRAGHGSSFLNASSFALRSRARAFVDEESEMMGRRGEVGLSLAETALDSIAARVNVYGEKVDRLRGQIEALENSRKRGMAEMEIVVHAEEEAVGREKYYTALLQFIEDVCDMLRGTASSTLSKINKDSEYFQTLIDKRLCDTDEFGRLKLIEISTDTDGYESPQEIGNADDSSRLSRMAEGVDVYRHGGQRVRDVADRIYAENDDPLSDVAEEFKSLSSISDRFVDWKARYPSDYDAAFGDLSLGKIAGTLGLVSQRCCDLRWITTLPKAATGPALVKARVAPRVALEVSACWEPQSYQSSRAYSAVISSIMDNLSGYESEASKAASSILDSAVRVLSSKVDVVRRIASRGNSDVLWSGRAAVKCARGTGLLLRSLLGRSDLSQVANVVVCELFGEFVCNALKELSKSGPTGDDFIKFSVFAIEQGCTRVEDGNALSMSPSIEFPDRMHHGWAPLRDELMRARELAKENSSLPEGTDAQVERCLKRIGFV